MKIKDRMTKNPTFVSPDDSIIDAASKMAKIDCGVLPVGKDKTHCLGMITDRDIVVRVVAKGGDLKSARVKDVMTKQVYYCNETDSLEKGAELMREHKVNRLVVKDENENVSGIISFGTLLWKAENDEELRHILECASPHGSVAA